MSARLAAVAVAFLLACPALAGAHDQSGPADPAPDRDLLVTIGLGPQLLPKYPGADSYHVSPRPTLSWRHPGEPIHFSAPDQSTSLGLLGSRSRFDFGPAVRLRYKRKLKDVGAPVDPVGFTVEAGGFAQAWLTPGFRLRAEARKGIGGHKGWVGDLGLDGVVRDDDRTLFSIGPRLRLGDGRFERAYFGVSPAAAVRTGLAAYRPNGGIYAAGAVTSILHQFSPTWGISAFAGYDRLVRHADVSPLVRRYGSRDQFSAGIGLTYTFRIRRH